MPAPGDQHTSIVNPFEDQKPVINEFTAQQIATLQSRLDKQLGPEYLSVRAGPGGSKLHYITAEKVISLANEIFGFNGWSSSIQNFQIDFVDEDPKTLKVSLGLSVIVRVTLRDGTYHEDLGYGHIENCRGKAAAFEKAKKEGTTDALKRALRHFGNVLGNCIYDKEYLKKIGSIRAAPTKLNQDNLHRHPDFVKSTTGPVAAQAAAPPQPQPAAPAPAPAAAPAPAPAAAPVIPSSVSAESFEDFLGELDEADFMISEEGHPDEVLITNSASDTSTVSVSDKSMQPPTARPLARTGSAGTSQFSRPQQQPQTPNPMSRTNAFVGAGTQMNSNNNNGPRPSTGQFTSGNQFNQNRPSIQQNNNYNQPPRPPVAQNGASQTNGQNNNTANGSNNNYNNNNNNNNNNSNNNNSNNNNSNNNNSNNNNSNNNNSNNNNNAAPAVAPAEVGFFSARAVKDIPEDALVAGQVTPFKAGMGFNPRAESPSIRKTPGIDHSTSKPLSRSGQHVPPTKTTETKPASGPVPRPGGTGVVPYQRPSIAGVTNPQLDSTRRIGVPGSGPGSPLANRNQYRPPTIKRPAPDAGNGNGQQQNGTREPLADGNKNAPIGQQANGGFPGPEAKRPRVA
ncbi:DNA repair protein rad52 [Podospora pseudoanserina]|uniref:DNA repair protein rad52 n=1 Tax=Podospora pseudoanserina TaxID=2609844 RepID=A0ABR0IJN6_9PEZI|nr:DNA repair protein rad52 [Podospora pseudoanserina]